MMLSTNRRVLGECRQSIGFDKGDREQDENHKTFDAHDRHIRFRSTEASSHVAQMPTAALSIPKSSDVRLRPSLGTRKIGNRSEAAKCTDVIEGKHAGNEIFEIELVL